MAMRPFSPTEEERELVRSSVAGGLGIDDLCLLIRKGISTATLYKYFKDELARGKAEAHNLVGKTILDRGLKNSDTLLIFYAKCRMGWNDKPAQTTQQEPEIKLDTGIPADWKL